MAADLIRYDLLVQDALRGVVRKVLSGVARDGVPGEHHFYIGFRTHARGVRLSSRMRELYPDEMTIVLQHQFWDLSVDRGGFRGRSIVPKYSGNAAHPVRCGDPFCRSVRGIRVAVLGRGRGGPASAIPESSPPQTAPVSVLEPLAQAPPFRKPRGPKQRRKQAKRPSRGCGRKRIKANPRSFRSTPFARRARA